ncbi:hypothetical protein C8J57DRAFT_1711791 [Mycena rebaudengoi]|nr:hypothetical protein C8J57DRAFT_1711791 [Mycena rebaudengoi]
MHVQTPPPTEATHDEIIWLAGPRLIGLIFNWGLLGVLTTQDKWTLKTLVYFVYVLDWVQTCSATYDCFQWFVYGWGSVPLFYLRHTGFLNLPLLGSVVGAIIFYGWRIWLFSRSLFIFVFVCVLALLQLGGGLALVYFLFNDAMEIARHPYMSRAIIIRLGGSAVVDTVIAILMTYYLLRSRGQALGPKNRFMTRVMRLTVEIGTVIVVAALIDLLFYLKETNAGLYQVTAVILCKMYSNSLLVLFNNRLSFNTWDYVNQDSTESRIAVRIERTTNAGDTTNTQNKSFKLDKLRMDSESRDYSLEHP